MRVSTYQIKLTIMSIIKILLNWHRNFFKVEQQNQDTDLYAYGNSAYKKVLFK